ncbi:MAG: LemA family protein [Bdellovibrionales bacterium]
MDAMLVTLGCIALIIVFAIITYNRLVALRQNREQSFADVDVYLKNRFDLIPNLLETVKGYASHEKEVFENITKARAGISDANTTSERISAENNLSRAMISLYAVAENYPDLKADGLFQNLMTELSDIENKLAASRRFFNNTTAELNTAVEQFPAIIFAGAFGFKKEEFFEIPEEDRETLEKAPDVKFN